MKEITCKTILSKSRLEDYSINPYRGCTHCCKYCYAPYILREGREWGTFIEPKINAPEVLEKELKRNKPGNIFISSVTDPYNSLENKYKLTRRVLEKLIGTKFTASIQTKSPLILRDLDLLKKIKCEVGMTITTFDEKARKVFEPNASPSLERLETLKKLKEEGIRTYVFFGPMMPFISDANLDGTVKKFSSAKPDKVFADRLNIKRPVQWTRLKAVLEKNYPELVDKWQNILFSDNDYYKELKKELVQRFKKCGLTYSICY